MPVPKFRTSASKRDMRRSHHSLKSVNLSTCSNCQEVKLQHVVCHSCGFYNGKQVAEPRAASSEWDGTGAEGEAGK